MELQFDFTKELLSEKVTNFLRKSILLGTFQQGQHLSENELSKQLSVSRGPVREAIRQLENEGLVHTPNNGRTMVIGFNQDDLSDLFDVRKTLETKAIRTIVSKGYFSDVTGLKIIIEQSRRIDSRLELISLDVMFHQELVKMSGNRTLFNLWSVIRGLASTLIEITTDIYEQIEQVPEAHDKLVVFIKNGDADQAVHLLTEHLETGETVIRNRLKTDK